MLSPGPCTPDDAGICLDLIAEVGATVPMLGVCLGHQAIGQAFGGSVIRAPVPVHGKLSEIRHRGEGVFRGINGPFKATRYHSLVVDRGRMPDELRVTAETDDGLVMGLAHTHLPAHGVQFHPESIASEHGHQVLRNFLDTNGDNVVDQWCYFLDGVEVYRKEQPAPRESALDTVAGVHASMATIEQATMPYAITALKQMGVVMKAAQAKLAGKRVDGKALSERVRSKLT